MSAAVRPPTIPARTPPAAASAPARLRPAIGRLWAALCLGLWAPLALASERFPKPDLSPGYVAPADHWPGLTAAWRDGLDVGILALALAAAAWLALRRRSRLGLQVLGLACLAYFGFWRRGCLCPVGSFQAVAEGLFQGVALPLPTVLFFMLPLLAALLWGRVFCAAVCPLGLLQDVVAVRPQRLSRPVDAALQVIPVVMLALGVLLAATQTAYLACRFDPLVPLLRLSGSAHGVLMGASFLLLGIFLARPYCRYICPYGVLLRGLSRLSWKHVTITPDTCVQCHLCAESCPFEAISAPTPPARPEAVRAGVRRLAWLVVATPVLVASFALLFSLPAPALARLHADVRLSEQLEREAAGNATPTAESIAFRASARTPPELHEAAAARRDALRRGGRWAGAFVGLVIALRLLGASLQRRRTDYEPDRGTCLSCGRCFRSCPQELRRLHPRAEA